MKKWENPIISELGIDKTFETLYVDYCDWEESVTFENNKDYTDPTKQPADHADWEWCFKHNRWHEKNHGATIS